MSENELNWWLARASKRPFPADQINILGTVANGQRKVVDWFKKPVSEDKEYQEAHKKKVKEIREKRKNESHRGNNTKNRP